MKSIVKAQNILDKIVQSKMLDFEITYQSIILSTELLTHELSITKNENIYLEIKEKILTGDKQ